MKLIQFFKISTYLYYCNQKVVKLKTTRTILPIITAWNILKASFLSKKQLKGKPIKLGVTFFPGLVQKEEKIFQMRERISWRRAANKYKSEFLLFFFCTHENIHFVYKNRDEKFLSCCQYMCDAPNTKYICYNVDKWQNQEYQKYFLYRRMEELGLSRNQKFQKALLKEKNYLNPNILLERDTFFQ